MKPTKLFTSIKNARTVWKHIILSEVNFGSSEEAQDRLRKEGIQ